MLRRSRIKGASVRRVVGPLLAKALIEVVLHRGCLPVYKTEADGSRLALILTQAGLLTLGIEPEPAPASSPEPVQEKCGPMVPEAVSAEATAPRHGAPGGNRIFMTVWDGGGDDTDSFMNYTNDLTIALRPGEWTTTSADQLAQLDTSKNLAV